MMTGNNELKLNHETMCRLMTLALNESTFAKEMPVKVMSVNIASSTGFGDENSFTLILQPADLVKETT